MLDNFSLVAKGKYSRLVIRPKCMEKSQIVKGNIFLSVNKDRAEDLGQIGNDRNREDKKYLVCGDDQFKEKFLMQKRGNITERNHLYHKASFYTENNALNNLNHDISDCAQKNPSNNKKQWKFSHHQASHTQTIYPSKQMNDKFLSTLHRTQQNLIQRQNQTLTNFNRTKQTWQQLQNKIKKRFPASRSQTVTFHSTKKVYLEDNPQKLEIVNDMLPEYWKNSLRGNDKMLKRHLKGNGYRREVVDEMLQTLKGTKKLEAGIPRLVNDIRQRTGNDGEINCEEAQGKKDLRECRREKQLHKALQPLVLKSNKLQPDQHTSTMRQYYKNVHNSLNSTIKQRHEQQSNTPRKNQAKPHFFSLNRTLPARKTNFPLDESQYLSKQEVHTLKFCSQLNQLDKIDNEVYKRQFETRGKWLHEGYDMTV